ncbi:unnamed protein product [Parnassius apollo]|uniref:(apollo) hypothetical protein n=1 Tax=Parnassius apollo TaxID=110799 RepID=A0A8S3WXR2_PARAO|nr:unnamed protein product [Parnassius apollo]
MLENSTDSNVNKNWCMLEEKTDLRRTYDILQQLVIDLRGEQSSDSEIQSEEEDTLDHDIVPIIYSEDEF